MTDTRSPMRALRAALFAAVCVTLAATGHSSMSAHDVPLGSLLLAFGVTGVLAWTAGGRRQGTPAIAAGLLAVQGALHLIFSAAEPHAAMPAHHPGMAMQTEMDMPTAGPGSIGMIAAHVLAAAVCGLWLARGEAAFFALAYAVSTLAFTPLRRLPTAVRLPDTPRPPRPRTRTVRRHRGVVLAHTLSRRGPPVLPVPRATALGAHV